MLVGWMYTLFTVHCFLTEMLLVSVLWTMDSKTFEVKNTWFGRSIIRSSCEMEYDQAQQLLDGEPVATNLSRLQPRSRKTRGFINT